MKKIDVVIKADLETLKILERLNIDAGELLQEAVRVKLKEWQKKWKEENAADMAEMSKFMDKAGHFRSLDEE